MPASGDVAEHLLDVLDEARRRAVNTVEQSIDRHASEQVDCKDSAVHLHPPGKGHLAYEPRQLRRNQDSASQAVETFVGYHQHPQPTMFIQVGKVDVTGFDHPRPSNARSSAASD